MPVALAGGSASPRAPPIALLALVTAIAPAALHMLVPAFPLLAADFDAAPARVQLVLTLFLAGIATGQLIYGPASDRFARRPVLLAGLALFLRRHGAVRGRLVAAGVDRRPHASGVGRLRGDGAGPGDRSRCLRPRTLGERLGDDHDGDEPGAVAVAGAASGLLGFMQMTVAALGTLLLGLLPLDSAVAMMAVVGTSLTLAFLCGLLALRRPAEGQRPTATARFSNYKT